MSNKTDSFIETKRQADLVDKRIRELILERKHFIVEAGAGSGKTYSLNEVVGWLEKERPIGLNLPRKKIACITYTNVAVDVMRSRLSPDSNVEPCTIHSFCWKLIKPFQSYMIGHIKDAIHSKKADYSSFNVEGIDYDLGVRHYDRDSRILSLYHDDVIVYFSLLLEEKKFRRIMASIYPVILIDEYQDSDKRIMNKMIELFLDGKSKPAPIFGLFGDSWQCIYSGLNGVGEIKNAGFVVVHKDTNFRSERNIVKMLNKLRPDNPQSCSKEDEADKGNVYFIHCDGSQYDRYVEGQKKDDLTSEELQRILNQLIQKIESMTQRKPKVLMITHNVISRNLGFAKLFDELGAETLRDQPDPFFEYCRRTVEPIYKALADNDASRLADVLGSNRVIVRTKKDKLNWKAIYSSLQNLREGNLRGIIEYCLENEFGLIPRSDDVEDIMVEFKKNDEAEYRDKKVKDVLSIPYHEFLSAFEYIDSESIFSTEHGSKGDEFENVIFVINKGWNQYQYHKYAPFNKKDDNPSFIRNRNLFYVCSSRAIKNMFFLLTYDGGHQFNDYLRYLADGNDREFKEFIDS